MLFSRKSLFINVRERWGGDPTDAKVFQLQDLHRAYYGPNKDQPRKVTLTGTTEQIVFAKVTLLGAKLLKQISYEQLSKEALSFGSSVISLN